MLAKAIILQRLEQSYVSLLSQQVENNAIGKTDLLLDCSVSLAHSLIKIYPWLEEGELDEWRDKVEEICKCELPCVNCGGAGDTPDYDPNEVIWLVDRFHCEDVPVVWLKDMEHCEDNGITTTVPQVTTTQPQFSTTLQQGQDCRSSINFIYQLSHSGPNELPFKYVDCNGIARQDVFIKGMGKCLTFIAGTVLPVDPADIVHFTASAFSIGVYPCGVNDIP